MIIRHLIHFDEVFLYFMTGSESVLSSEILQRPVQSLSRSRIVASPEIQSNQLELEELGEQWRKAIKARVTQGVNGCGGGG